MMRPFKHLHYKFSLPELPYAFDALNPYIETQIMELHYTKHHQAYIDNLDKALETHPDMQQYSLFELLSDRQHLPTSIRDAVRNNGGGHLNHSMFWQLMKPNTTNEIRLPRGRVAQEIIKHFGSFEAFKHQFEDQAKKVFGSGWAWLCVDNQGTLLINKTANQDNPISLDMTPIMGLDVWEHAYYLQYFNRRADYIQAWWYLINWDQVEENFLEITE